MGNKPSNYCEKREGRRKSMDENDLDKREAALEEGCGGRVLKEKLFSE